MASLIQELKRRKVFRVAAVYAIVAWLIIQVAGEVLPTFNAPQWVNQSIVFLLLLGFPLALVLAWAFEITPDGVKPDVAYQAPLPGAQTVDRKLIYVILALVLLVVGFQFSDRFSLAGQQPGAGFNSASALTQGSSPMRATINLDQPLARIGVFDYRTHLDLTPDGSTLLYINNQPGGLGQVLVRNLLTEESRLLHEGVALRWPRFSPDGQRVLISAASSLTIIPIDGGFAEYAVADSVSTAANWLSDEEVVYTGIDLVVHKISLLSGEDTVLTQLGDAVGHFHPRPLPGGDSLLFTSRNLGENGEGSGNDADIKILNLDSGETKTLINGGYFAQYSPSGHIVYLQSGDLLAVPFDLESMEVLGVAARVAIDIDSQPMAASASYTFSDTGRLLYLPGVELSNGGSGFNWVDRNGEKESIPLPPGTYSDPELSPDGQALALTSTQTDGSSDIWVFDLSEDFFNKRTFTGNAFNPKWTPDGLNLVYQMADEQGIWSASSDGSGQTEQIYRGADVTPDSFSSVDGKLLYLEGVVGSRNLNALSYRDSVWTSAPIINTEYNTWGGVVSPDGKWIAYVNGKSGRQEIYVHPYPDLENGTWQISTQGGREPKWGPNGDELFFLGLGGNLKAVDISTEDGFAFSAPQTLLTGFNMATYNPPSYAVSIDGQRFIQFEQTNSDDAVLTAVDVGSASLAVIENWFEELKRLAPPDTQ